MVEGDTAIGVGTSVGVGTAIEVGAGVREYAQRMGRTPTFHLHVPRLATRS